MQKTSLLAYFGPILLIFRLNGTFLKILYIAVFFNSVIKKILNIIVPNFKKCLMSGFQATLVSDGRTHPHTDGQA